MIDYLSCLRGGYEWLCIPGKMVCNDQDVHILVFVGAQLDGGIIDVNQPHRVQA